jgi:hypothetical protein
MADLNLSTADPFTVALVQRWVDSKELVDQLDEKMALESFGRTKLLNTRFDAANPNMEGKVANNSLAVSIRDALSADGLSDEEFAGLYETVRRTLKEFDKRLDAFVEANITKVDESDKPKEAELVELRKERKSHVDNMNGIRTLLEGTAPDWFNSEGISILGKDKIENLRGAVGDRSKTGKRLGGTFQFTVFYEDTETALSDRKLSAVQIYLKKHVKNVGELWKAIEEQNPNFDRANPPDRFEFTIAGRRIVANKMADESSEDDDDDSTEDIDELTLDLSDDNPEDFEADTKELFDDDES